MSQLNGIDVFVKVVQSGSFTGAAKLLGMPVTTVSGKVKELELRLGVTLITRTTRKLSITEIGSVYFEHCLKAINEINSAENALINNKAEPEGLLRITTAPDIGHALLPKIVTKYLAKYPKTKIEIVLTNRMMDLVGESIDLAIRPGKLKDSTLMTKKFKDTEGALWASRDFVSKYGLPKIPTDIEKLKFIGLKMVGNKIVLSNGKKQVSIQTNPRIILDDIEAVKVFVLQNEGIGIMPKMILENEIKSGKIVNILPDWKLFLGPSTSVGLSFVYPPHKFIPPKVQAFIDLALKENT